MKSTLAVIKQHDYNSWQTTASRAGTLGPYGVDKLKDHGFGLTWSDMSHHRAMNSRGIRRVRATVDRRSRSGLAVSLTSTLAVSRGDAILSIFEDSGLAISLLKSLSIYPFNRRPHIMLTCWLAENVSRMDCKQKQKIRRRLEQVDRVVVFSRNQIPTLSSQLELNSNKFHPCAFGVDTSYFKLASDYVVPRGNKLLAVGRDQSRDYRTFFSAIRGKSYEAVLVCHPDNIKGLDVPPNCELRTGVSHHEYRDLLRSALAVVTPTNAPLYPAGQTVLLESMSTGAANIVTDSPAIREYVTHERDAILVPRGDPNSLSCAIDRLIENRVDRNRIGASGRDSALENFDHVNMWTQIAKVINVAVEERHA